MFRNVLDDRGRVIINDARDPNGNLVSSRDNDHVATRRSHYDDCDDLIEVEELDPAGALVLNDIHFARRLATYDDHGRELQDPPPRRRGPADHPKDEAPVLQVTWDERGNRAGLAFFDGHGHPFTNAHGYASLRWRHDRFRNEVEQAVFDAGGRPCTDDAGVSVVRSTYDEHDDLAAPVSLAHTLSTP